MLVDLQNERRRINNEAARQGKTAGGKYNIRQKRPNASHPRLGLNPFRLIESSNWKRRGCVALLVVPTSFALAIK